MKPTAPLRNKPSVFATSPLDFIQVPGFPSAIETRSLPHTESCAPAHSTSRLAHLCRSRPHGSVHSLLPSSFYLLCRLARRSIRQAHALSPYCCSTLAVAYDVFF